MSLAGAPAGVLFGIKLTEAKNRFSRGEKSWFKIFVVSTFGAAFWAGLFAVFDEGLGFILRYPELARELMEYLLAVFFFFLGLMLVFSNAIISWTSLFRSRETAFLMSAPVRVEHLFFYKFTESLWFSSWAFLFLGTPLMVAYGRRLHLGPGFYVGAALLTGMFVFIPAGIGNLAALLIARFVPRLRKRILVVTGTFLLASLFFLVYRILMMRGYATPDTGKWMRAVMSYLSFSQSPLCPSYWVAGGIGALAHGPGLDVGLYGLALLANALFFTRTAYTLARRWLFDSWCVAQAATSRKLYRENALLERTWNLLFFYCPAGLRLLVLKDLRAFVRDPVQWSQFLIFFGLLGVYFLNLRSFAYHLKVAEWKTLIALLNLCATSLTLSTFTSRFVFPQLSLEGRRFWLLGAAPAERRMILVGKFLFSFFGSLVVSESLILVSGAMLLLSASTVVLHAVAIVGICFGLAGLSVGLGALYPDFREDNPSKIVAGFGGTLNLILSLAFVACIVALAAWLGRESLLAAEAGLLWNRNLLLALFGIAGVSALTGTLPMLAGFRAIRKLEI